MRRSAFTIIELLVVIGIIALLIGILLPALFMARGMAMKVVCSVRLRDLSVAATMYQTTNHVYPPPMQHLTVGVTGPATFRPAPQQISAELLNELRAYLRFPEIQPTTPVSGLPPFVQCPFVEMTTEDRGPFTSPAPFTQTYYTGYAYLGRVPEVSVKAVASTPSPTSPTSILPPLILPIPLPIQLPNLPLIGGLVPVLEPAIELKPGRAPEARSTKRAVLWSDNVSQTSVPDRPWQYTHTRRATRGGSAIRYNDPSELIGQHRAFNDGSVEWVKAKSPELELEPAPSANTAHASLKTLLGELWWF
ncbi:MAG: hypothetical protein JWM57_841 [Phycisphaerales bacterium]|nr:hypothetical protein [Phycisphaerales bacterium]